ncbi:MAG: AmmeMemoRadiSam system radical SAM enzyme [candidate division Zixibacteria bacterium]|nr:AmmeMemoRadiSam system radical SAM enzyme [candidate division Zixibacteria bacterium]
MFCLSRRKFLKSSVLAGTTSLLPFNSILNLSQEALASERDENLSWVEAKYYDKLQNREIQCQLCPRECKVGDRERGYCGVRENRGGIYYTLVYSKVCSANVDPIEKKPFFHFLPGTKAFSIATAGCNLNCKFCQNWEISQVRPEQINSFNLPPEKVPQYAVETDSRSIAYTYTEPVVFYEYMLDCAKAGKARNIKNVVVSAGYIKKEPLIELCKYVDAIKIDFKGFTQEYYQDICHAELKPVMETLIELKKIGIWYEMVYLMLPTLNDDPKEIKSMCDWMVKNLGVDVPIHFTRFYPMYLLKNLPTTPVSSLERAKEIADEVGMKFVYIGNVPGHKAESTYCPKCKNKLIDRTGYRINEMNLKDGKCKFCNEVIPGVWR